MKFHTNHIPLLLISGIKTASLVSAFPDYQNLDSRAISEGNCGSAPCTTFDAKEQYVDVSPGGPNPYIAPGPNDIRGPCPGLNAVANHGFFPRNGKVNLAQTIDGMAKAFGMGVDFSTVLSILATLFSGDIGGLTWSIGGPYSGGVFSELLGQPEGISYSHNRYESDASTARADAYMNNGDSTSLIMSKFEHLYNLADPVTNRYTIENIRAQHAWNRNLSVSTNPYYFSGAFSGLLVAPAAHNFIITFMSNHSATNPNGYMDKSILKTFFGITGPDNALVWHPGQEQIPQNWYRRPSTSPYDIKAALLDILINAAENPQTIQIGGNTGKVNSFTGIDLGNLTGGVYTADNLLKGNNLFCFAFQAASAGLVDAIQNLSGLAGVVTEEVQQLLSDAEKLLNVNVQPILNDLGCPSLVTYNESMWNQFPGYTYRPKPSGSSGGLLGSLGL